MNNEYDMIINENETISPLWRKIILAERPEDYLQPYQKGLKRFVETFPNELELSLTSGVIYTYDAKYWQRKGNNCYDIDRDYVCALDCYIKAIKIDQDNADLWYSKGNALFKLNRIEDALQTYDVATSLDPRHLLAWKAKCIILRALHRNSEAEYACSKS